MESKDEQQNGPEEQPTGPTEEQPAPATRRLTRSRDNRVIGGVCGGLGRYFDVDPVIFRIAAVALAFVGGAGLLLYFAALLLVPTDDGTAVVSTGAQGRNRALVIGGVIVLLLVMWPFLVGGGLFLGAVGIPLAILVATGVVVWWLVTGEGPSGDPKDIVRRAALGVGVLLLSTLVFFGGFVAAAAGPDWLLPALVLGAGAAILAGAFMRPIRWLVPPALALALAAGTVAASGIDFDGGVGEREYRPATTADLRDRYELGVGELVVDLRETDLPAGDVPLEMDLGLGEARLVVPEDVCVATSADVGIGNVRLFGRDNGGIDIDFEERPDARPDVTRLVLDAEVGVGEVRVQDDEFDFVDDRDDNAACEATGTRASG